MDGRLFDALTARSRTITSRRDRLLIFGTGLAAGVFGLSIGDWTSPLRGPDATLAKKRRRRKNKRQKPKPWTAVPNPCHSDGGGISSSSSTDAARSRDASFIGKIRICG